MNLTFSTPALSVDISILMFQLEKKYLGDTPYIEGSIVPNNLADIYADIVQRRDEIYPNCLSVSNPSDFDYVTTDWESYHDYIALEKFPQLDFILLYIKQSLELMEDTNEYYFKSWINIWPQGQSLGYHTHYGQWHGYYVIKDTGTKTFYFPDSIKEPVGLDNYDGHFIFMNSKVPHLAQLNPSTEFRVSIGFNLSSSQEIDREVRTNANGRGDKIKNVITPLKELI